MGRGPAEARACLFYGIPVRTRSLILAGIAYRRCVGAFDVLDELRAAGRQDRGPAATRVPVEVWDHVEKALIAAASQEAVERRAFRTQCAACKEAGRKWVKLDNWVGERDEYGSRMCSECGEKYWDGVRWRKVLREKSVQQLVDSLLCLYGLTLPTTEQFILSRHGCSPSSPASFISLSSTLDGPVDPAYGCTRGFETARNRNLLYTSHMGGFDNYYERDQASMMLVEVTNSVPADAVRRFELLREDWPILEYLDFRDAEFRFVDDDEEGAEEEKKEDSETREEVRVRPSWRLFLKAVDTSSY